MKLYYIVRWRRIADGVSQDLEQFDNHLKALAKFSEQNRDDDEIVWEIVEVRETVVLQ